MLGLGKTIRRLRQRLELNMQEFGERLGVTGASVSRYEAEKASPSQAVLKLIYQLAETDEERQVLSAAMERSGETEEDNVIKEIRKASGMDRRLFAVRVGAAVEDVDRWEAGVSLPSPSFVDKLKALAAEYGRADLALTLSSSEWTVKAVFHPGEMFISQHGNETPAEAARRERLHHLLDELIASGRPELLNFLESTMLMGKSLVCPSEKTQSAGRKRAG